MGASIVAMAIRVAAAALVEERSVRRKLWYAEYAMTTSTVHSKAVIYLSLLVKPQQLISTDFSVM